VRCINISDPAVDRDAEFRLLYDGRLFTDEVTDADEEPTLLEAYADGLRHGPWRAWYFDGSMRAEGRYQEGQLVGKFQKWHENGRPASRKVYSEAGPNDGRVRLERRA
jgi:antitoxin component YwqK of YwqJK toxin-antitoxin module